MNEYFCTSPAHAPITFVMVRGWVSYTTQTLTIRRLCCHFSQSLNPSYNVPWGYSREFLFGLCRPVLQILTLFQTKKMLFSTQARPLKFISVFRPGRGVNTVITFRLELKQKDFLKTISNSLITLSFWFIWNWNDKYAHTCTPVVSFKTILDSRPKWASLSVFRAKRRKNHTVWGDRYLYGLYKGALSPGSKWWSTLIVMIHSFTSVLRTGSNS